MTETQLKHQAVECRDSRSTLICSPDGGLKKRILLAKEKQGLQFFVEADLEAFVFHLSDLLKADSSIERQQDLCFVLGPPPSTLSPDTISKL